MSNQIDIQSASRITRPLSEGDIPPAQRRLLHTSTHSKWKLLLTVIRHIIMLPVILILKPVWTILNRGSNALGSLSALLTFGAVVYGVYSYILEEPQRKQAAHNTTWQLINSANGQAASGGRIEALQQLNEDNISLEGLVASSANLQQIRLPNADLKKADLRDANLSYAYLQGAYLEDATLQRSKLMRTDLEYSNLQYVYLQYANLEGADLQYANLKRAHLESAELKDAGLQHAQLQGAYLQKANLSHADLQETNLQGAYLQEANLQSTYLQSAYLKSAYLQYANLQYAYLQGTDFTDADIAYADFRNSMNLTASQVRLTKNWALAKFDTNLKEALGLNP